MSIFSSIMSKIFGRASASSPDGGTNAPPGGMAAAAATAAPAAGAAGQAAAAPVDVAAVLTGMAANNPQKLDWQHSIVDLMKLLNLDSGLAARTELARELSYTGSTDDTASMNIWLHKQVMTKLAENGGRVPDSLRS